VDGQALRALTAQAFERAETTESGAQNYVTVLGRFDVSLFLNSAAPETWATEAKALRFGIDIDQSNSSGAQATFRSPVGAIGTARSSIEQAYVSTIKSRATLAVRTVANGRESIVWSSATMKSSALTRQTGLFQRLSDRWAAGLVSRYVALPPNRLSVSQSLSGHNDIIVSLQSEPVLLPAIATRAFAFLSLALLLVIVLGWIWLRAVWRVQSIARSAYKMTSLPSMRENLQQHAAKRDEIGRLARVLDFLIKRSRSKNIRFLHRKAAEFRVATEKAKLRHAILEAIGHEIRSPLQSLINRTANDSVYSSDLQRMARAVDALYKATTVEAGLSEGLVILERLDLAQYLMALTTNRRNLGDPIEYLGVKNGVFSQFDQINLDQALQHVIDNAIRYHLAGSNIEVRLQIREASVDIEIFNQGPQIAPDRLERIFELGESSRDGPSNRGQGLFVARSLIAAMNGSVRAENELNGVCFIFELPTDLKAVHGRPHDAF
jgi:signal transduction histidine kinase